MKEVMELNVICLMLCKMCILYVDACECKSIVALRWVQASKSETIPSEAD
jgi:hypothetical protein